jgi:hypothetical protein
VDPRRNLNGRPRSFDALRAIAQEICHEELELKDGRKIIVAEAVLRAWAKSPEPTLQKAFIEYAFGKVPDKVDMTTEHKTKLFLNYAHDSDRGADSSNRTARLPSGTN